MDSFLNSSLERGAGDSGGECLGQVPYKRPTNVRSIRHCAQPIKSIGLPLHPSAGNTSV
jgi:hypothetical protein